MAADLARSALAANRDVPDGAPGPFQDCRTEVHVMLFFDGTGNNKDADIAEKKWSNVARLYESAALAAQSNKKKSVFPVYIRGVGTTSNNKATDWLENAIVWMEDNLGGGGAGSGGDRRMDHGRNMVNDHLRDVLIANAKSLGGRFSKYATESSRESLADINAVLSKFNLIKVIDISIFGFSRGAALARAFSNRILGMCTDKEGQLFYQGYPLRISFVGIFDTVASFGVPSMNARTPFTERELIVSPFVERCVHYIAAHELRFSFPVDLIRKNGKLAGNWVERAFPGVHSDVGGGYGPRDQSVDNNYARIPLREMMREALLSGVRIISYEDLKRSHNSIFRERFECRPETEAAYAKYITECGRNNRSIENQITAHMKLYYSAHGTLSRRRGISPGERIRRSSVLKSLLGPDSMATEVALWRSTREFPGLLRYGLPTAARNAQYVKLLSWQLAAWDTNASDAVVNFFTQYIHDSKVDFLMNVEPFSYFMQRGVDESSISIWKEGGNWLHCKEQQIGNALHKVAVIGEESVRVASDAAGKIGRDALDSTDKIANNVADAVHSGFNKAADFTTRKVRESAEMVNDAYDTAADTGTRAAKAVERKVNELEEQVEKIYDSGMKWSRLKIERH
ncbi:DUF2235 domain-containing protein [Herbaspirillum sp. SJZ107]|uniref:T6SS phospholipase effector Tle1-like catalytic domain-containing protein n=1 Tax=Herbaspirillum sp. SJZ107 TaxID=2572881 RepID=UPI00114DFA19|nr:DUF2235 domain-containing protein [Herbaspirillum sp. SJZ107]TQK10667.1 putative alpha/beta hydrolase family protein DUF2235 [Herbaspirillum sp. SJZ107]